MPAYISVVHTEEPAVELPQDFSAFVQASKLAFNHSLNVENSKQTVRKNLWRLQKRAAEVASSPC